MKTVLHINGKPIILENMSKRAHEVSFTLGGKTYHFRSRRLPDGSSVLERELERGVWQRLRGSASQAPKNARILQFPDLEAKISEVIAGTSAASQEMELSPAAPMPGLIRQILVKMGDKVSKGDKLIMMEAMKLQTVLSAGGDGIVEAVLVKEGEMVTEGRELVRIAPLEKK